MNKMQLVLGDWSDDGHGKSESIHIETNKTLSEVRQAYLKSCELTKLAFDEGSLHRNYHHIAVDYEDNILSEEIIEILKEFNYPFINELEDEDNYIYTDNYVRLWFWFIGLSLDDFQYEIIKDTIPVINGYWNKELNVSFGYGLYQ